MEGAHGESWTAAQVERNRAFSVDEVLTRWSQQAPAFAELIEQVGQGRPPIDCHGHEHDIRHALGRPGVRSNAIVDTPSFAMVEVPIRVVIEIDGGATVTSGDLDAGTTVTLRDASRFDLFRSRVGRRSREQVRAHDWSGTDADIDAVVDVWFGFGPSLVPIIE